MAQLGERLGYPRVASVQVLKLITRGDMQTDRAMLFFVVFGDICWRLAVLMVMVCVVVIIGGDGSGDGVEMQMARFGGGTRVHRGKRLIDGRKIL